MIEKNEKNKKYRKKSLKNKIVTSVIVGLLVSMTVMPALANNHDDSAFNFDFYDTYWETTLCRSKMDDSYVYMNCTYSNVEGDSYEASVWGLDAETNTDFESSIAYVFFVGTVRKMTNYVYENGGEYAFIRAHHSAIDARGYFRGLWSPDSI